MGDGVKVTKEIVKERLAHLGGLIQKYRGEKIDSVQLRHLVKEAIESSGITFYGTEMDRIEAAISRYENALEIERVRKYVTDALDELFGSEEPRRGLSDRWDGTAPPPCAADAPYLKDK